MLTTTLDGLWVLQVLTGREVIGPELGLRPHFPNLEPKELALAHPIAHELRNAGALGDDGMVDEVIAEWLAVLARRESALIFYQDERDAGMGKRHLLARFARWWVSVQRCDATVHINGIGSATSEESAASLIGSYLQNHWGDVQPAEFRPLTLPTEHLVEAVRRTGNPQAVLSGLALDSDQASILTLAGDTSRSTQLSVVAIQSGEVGGPASTPIGASAVTVIDTPRGRVLSEHLPRDGRSWLMLGPGSHHSITAAVLRMLRPLPAQETWHAYRKVI